SQNINDGNDTHLLQDEQENTIIIDFGSPLNLKIEHNLDWKY
ncbi:unnamed protein product, partial [Rotaria sp. Silwood2]